MKEYLFKPDSEHVKGEILIKVPSFSERLKIAKEAGIKSGEEPDLDKIADMYDSMGKYVLKVDCKVDGEKVTSLDELGMYQEGVVILTEAISILAGGIPSPKLT